MTESWDNERKIKVDMTDFDYTNVHANEEIKLNGDMQFSDDYNSSEDDYSYNSSSQESINLSTNYPEYEYTSGYSEYSKSDESKISIDVEKPNEKSKQKIFLFFAVVLCIIVIPIMYHGIKEQLDMYNEVVEEQNLIVTVKQFSPVELYTSSEATGEITPESSVDVVSRVDGYLQQTFFKEGQNINKGQLLFKIEPDEYEIQVRASEAAVAQAQAIYTNALQELERGKELVKENFISRSDYDQIVASANSSKASLDEVKQTLARARLNLNYTNIYSPLSGKAGKINLSDGNYVGLSSGPLVNIARTNPIGVSFSMKSADVIKMKQGNKGKLDLSTAKVELILSDDSKYNKVGKIIFSNNYVSSDAASLALKATFENKDNLLIPGDYVKVIVTSATPINRILVPQSVVRGDALNGYYVWVAENNLTVKKMIEVAGSRDNHWIVESGLSSTDNVIVNSNIGVDIEKMPIKEVKTITNK